MNKTLFEQLIKGWQYNPNETRKYAEYGQDVLDQSEIIKRLRVVSRHMCNGDKLAKDLFDNDVSGRDIREFINLYELRIIHTMSELSYLQNQLSRELLQITKYRNTKHG